MNLSHCEFKPLAQGHRSTGKVNKQILTGVCDRSCRGQEGTQPSVVHVGLHPEGAVGMRSLGRKVGGCTWQRVHICEGWEAGGSEVGSFWEGC